MISVKKYFHNIPEILTSEDVNRSLESLTVKEALKEIYHNKCAYCESKLEHIEIDHYRPVEKYPWLAYEWSNLLPVCSDCRKSKASQFPLRGSRVKIPQQDKNEWGADSESFMTEEPLLLHPGIDTPEDHLCFDIEGKIHPKNNSERGSVTIETCDLNRPELVRERESMIEIFEKLAKVPDMRGRKNLTVSVSDVISEMLVQDTLIEKYSEDVFFNKEALPHSIKQFQIKNYHGIIRTGIRGIPLDTRWIFLTGENGFGKTCVLQAIVIGLFGNRDGRDILTDDDCSISVELKTEGENRICLFGHPKFESLATYGPSRLTLQNQESKNEISRKSTVTYSLFNTDGVLLNIEYHLVIWNLKNDARYDIVKQALLRMLPYVRDIKIADEEVFYVERETGESGKTYKPMPFEKLASGHRNIIAMVGDMLIRFFRQQPDVRRTEDFHGIVFIDELDSHLHPKWQRELPALLSEVFPKVQFVASTHSVIPFLGAPENSVFLKVTRNRDEGVQIERVDMDIRNLLPNTLLTSPLFDMEKLTHQNNENLAEVRTEDSYDEMMRNDEIRSRLKAFEESDMDFSDDLFETEE